MMTDCRKPNILFIAIDDLNQWLGCLGKNPDVKTPHMDRLAKEGMLFSNAVCPSPVCNPSRTSILTGLQPSTTGCYLLADNLENSPQRDRTQPLPLHLRHNGYHTLTAGKIDHGGAPVERATQKTFGESMWDDNAGYFNGQQFGTVSKNGGSMRHVNGWPAFANNWGPMDEEEEQTLSDVMTTKWAVDKLAQDYDKPFFMGAGFFRPHVPLVAPQRFFDMYDKGKLTLPETGPEDLSYLPPVAQQISLAGFQDYERGTHCQIREHGFERDILQAYLACISFTDDCIGQILTALDNSPHADNTIVILWADNGYSLGDHFHWKKWSLWDSGAQVPLIIKAPGITGGNEVCDQPVSLVDLYPTILDLCGLPPVSELEGESLRGLLSGDEPRRERPALTFFGPNNVSIRNERYRYTRYCDGSEELYDHKDDALEFHNLAAEPALTEVRNSFRQWLPKACAPCIAAHPEPGATLRLEPGQAQWFRGVEHGFANARIRISATISLEGKNGIIAHHGGYFANYALYIKDRTLCMAVADVETPLRWNRLDLTEDIIRADETLPEGEVKAEGVLDTDGSIELRVDGRVIGSGNRGHALSVYPSGLLHAGFLRETAYLRVGDAEYSEEFPGSIKDISIAFGE